MKIGNAHEILSLVRLATLTPQSYRRLIICAPFISDRLLRILVARNGAAYLPTGVITRPETAERLGSDFRGQKGLRVRFIQNLYAKIYMACGKADRDSIVLLGSINLTETALQANFELGIRVTARTEKHRRIIIAIESRLLSVAQFMKRGA